MSSTTRLVKTACQLTYDARDYVSLNSSINTLSKKHGQLKGAVQAMVELSIGWLDEIKERDGVEKWLELVETLRAVTEGKVHCLVLSFIPQSLTPTHIDLPRNSPRSRDAPPLEIPRTTCRFTQRQNPKGISTDRLGSPFGPTGRNVLLDGTEREDRIYSGADATADCRGPDEGRVCC